MTYVEFRPSPRDGKPMPAKKLRKADEPLTDPLDYNHTQPIVQKEKRKYSAVQAQLIQRGYKPSDFDKGGALYGRSNNELINLLENLKANNGGE